MPFPPRRLLGEGRHPPAGGWRVEGNAGMWGGLPGLGATNGTPLTCKCTQGSPAPATGEAFVVRELPVPLPLRCQGSEAFPLQDLGKSQRGMTASLAWAKLL